MDWNGVNLWCCKLGNFDQTKFIVWNIQCPNLMNLSRGLPSKKKYKERRRKGAPLIMSRSSKAELRFSKNGGSAVSCGDAIEVHRTEWFAVHRFYSSFGVPFLLLFWSSVTTPLLELRYYSSFGALLLLLFN